MTTIAIDIDEVLALHNEHLVPLYNTIYNANHTIDEYTTDAWPVVWGVSGDEAEKRAVFLHEQRFHRQLQPIPGALDAIKKLKQKHRLVVVTARRRMIIDDTIDWIAEHFPDVFDDIRFLHMFEDEAHKTKAEICTSLGADILIDDSVSHVTTMAECGKQAVLFGDYVWNQLDELPVGVVRLANWQSVLEHFDV